MTELGPKIPTLDPGPGPWLKPWAGLVALTVIAMLLVLVWVSWIRPHQCGGRWYDRDLFRVGDQCIGTISAQGASFGPDVADIIEEIGKANAAVDRTVQHNPDASWVRIAVAMPMTGSKPESDDRTPVRGSDSDYDPQAVLPTGPIVHSLHGAYVAQKRANDSDGFGSHNGVLIKLVLMNMGSQEKSWALLKPKVSELAQDTAHPLVAVVGLGVSLTETEQFARWLHESARVPAIGALLSAVGDAPGLFNVSPSNEDYVKELHAYLSLSAGRGTTLRYVEAVDQNGEPGGSSSDLYVADLHQQFRDAFDARQIPFRGTTGKGPGRRAVFTQVTQDVCGPSPTARPVVLFDGRPRDLQPLLSDLADANCPNEPIVAAAATGVVMNETMRDFLARAKTTLVFVSTKNTGAWLAGGTVQRPEGFDDFVKAYRKELNPPAATLGPSLEDGYAVGLYDAVGIAATALRKSPGATEDPPPNGPDVMIGLQNSNTGQTSIRVASGNLYFLNSPTTSYACGRVVIVSEATGASRFSAQKEFTTTTKLRKACQCKP
jgi:hypothetical protein